MPRGGKRPGAGAPRGNTNALLTGRYSPRIPREAGYIPKILPAYRAHLWQVGGRNDLEGKRLLARYTVAAALAIERTPQLAYDIETAIFAHRNRARRVEKGQAFLEMICRPHTPRPTFRAITTAGWFIPRDSVIAEALVRIIQPPFEAALETLYPTTPTKDAATIKQSNNQKPRKSNPRRPANIDCSPRPARQASRTPSPRRHVLRPSKGRGGKA